MNKRTLFCFFFAGVCALQAGPILTITPGTGGLAGLPGGIVGWGFSLTNDSTVDTLTVNSSFLIGESNSALGTYTDIISFFGGPFAFALPTLSTWTEAFTYDLDPSNQAGLGYFQIDPGATSGMTDSATLSVQYELDNAATGAFDSSGSFDLPVSITVQTPAQTPEPGTAWMLILGVALLFSKRLAAMWQRH
jgi:hypothetical protein